MKAHETDTQIDLQASEWLIRLEDVDRPLSARQQAEFFEWLRRSPRHVTAFFGVAGLWQELEHFDANRQVDVAELVRSRRAEVTWFPAASGRALGADTLQTPRRWWRYVAALAACCTLALFAWGTWVATPEYSTKQGEQRSIALADGSVIHLNTQSRVRVTYSEQQRRIELLSGEALFIVAHDSSRPFAVQARTSVIHAVGTQFNVHEKRDGTTIAVLEGKVKVIIDAENPRQPSMMLAAGEQANVTDGHASVDRSDHIANTLAWRERRLVFHDATLAEVAEEFNRYNKIPINVDPKTGQNHRLTGIFSADHPQSLLLYLERQQALDVERRHAEVTIRERQGQ